MEHVDTDDCYWFAPKLCYLWNKMQQTKPFFSSSLTYGSPVTGRAMFLAELCAKGDFSHYINFVRNINNTKSKICKNVQDCGYSMFGIFALIVIFIRLDLVNNYIHTDSHMCYAWNTIHFLFDPRSLKTYCNNLSRLAMVPLTLENELFEFDFISNSRYHPRNRIMMLWKLCWSTGFTCGLLRHGLDPAYDRMVCEKVKTTIMNSYKSFNNFQSNWCLNEYSDLSSNVLKQKEIYKNFKIIVQ